MRRWGTDARGLRRLTAAAALALALAPGAAAKTSPATVVLSPPEAAPWTPSRVLDLLRPRFDFGPHRIRVETTPPGAVLDFVYLRAGRRESTRRATAPATLVLPERARVGSRDVVRIRASLDGYRSQNVRVPARSARDRVSIALAPLPNTLEAVTDLYLAGRESLTFLFDHRPAVRVREGKRSFSLVLAETKLSAPAARMLRELQSPWVRAAEGRQLDEDLLVRVELTEHALQRMRLRSRESEDSVRNLHRLAFDLEPRTREARGIEQARAALARLNADDVSGCALRLDASLRRSLDRSALSRALAPRGEFVDSILRAALRRLGELSPGGVIQGLDGSQYRPGVPLELSLAASRAASARGYLALLERFVAELEPPSLRTEALRGLIAPEMDPRHFAAALAAARQAEQRCAASASAVR